MGHQHNDYDQGQSFLISTLARFIAMFKAPLPSRVLLPEVGTSQVTRRRHVWCSWAFSMCIIYCTVCRVRKMSQSIVLREILFWWLKFSAFSGCRGTSLTPHTEEIVPKSGQEALFLLALPLLVSDDWWPQPKFPIKDGTTKQSSRARTDTLVHGDN